MTCSRCRGAVIRRFVGSTEVWRHLREPADGHSAVLAR